MFKTDTRCKAPFWGYPENIFGESREIVSGKTIIGSVGFGTDKVKIRAAAITCVALFSYRKSLIEPHPCQESASLLAGEPVLMNEPEFGTKIAIVVGHQIAVATRIGSVDITEDTQRLPAALQRIVSPVEPGILIDRIVQAKTDQVPVYPEPVACPYRNRRVFFKLFIRQSPGCCARYFINVYSPVIFSLSVTA